VLGASAEGGIGNDVPIILHDTIGLHVKQVVGYPDSPAIFVAIERGEVHGRTVDLSTLKSVRPDWLKPDGGFRVLVQFGRASRHPQLPEVPTARELARNEAARSLIELAELPYSISRPVAAPPGLPGERATALVRAFRAVQRDAQYLDDAASLRLDVSPVDGDEVLRAIEAVASAPPEFLEYARKLFAETKGGG
jgi:tripartite-type tricarboxylate transporter receptor subunit TctC